MIAAMLQGFFIAIVALCLMLVVWAMHLAVPRREHRLAAGAILVAWLIGTAEFAHAGALAPSPDHPPFVALLALIAGVAFSAVALSPLGRNLATAISPAWVVGFQAFRLPVELFLWLAVAKGLAPPLMSFGGRNFDIITGVMACVIAPVIARKPAAKSTLLLFHVIGLALLANVVIHAVLAQPGPLQQLYPEPPLDFVTTWPYVWLPAVLVPLALGGHVLGLRQAMMKLPKPAPAA